jgi:hypothetical protein
MRPLTAEEKWSLEAAVGERYRVVWLEGLPARWRATSLLFSYAKLRLTMPEAYEVHRSVIEWNARHSEDRMPDGSLGVDPMTAKLMRFVMQSWGRVRFFNTFLAGTWVPRLQMDLLPGMACAGHFAIVAQEAASSVDDYMDAGRAAQRFWLTATRLGLLMQPEMTPLIFTRYVRERTAFTTTRKLAERAPRLAGRLQALLGAATDRAVFMGRVGSGVPPQSRSHRLPLEDLLQPHRSGRRPEHPVGILDSR